jgi:hypothetical protein
MVMASKGVLGLCFCTLHWNQDCRRATINTRPRKYTPGGENLRNQLLFVITIIVSFFCGGSIGDGVVAVIGNH